ncbi:MAG: hypothetical protein LBM98_06775 [Oscillospiraceae bacterium]|nr:hypothetical protein [Oscillospiraceae bacterium]
MLRRISLTTYRKCGGGFAKTGRGKPCPRARRGEPPRRTQPSSKPSKAPLFRGGCLRRGGGCRNPRPNPIPSVEGCRPQAAGWFPPQGATPVQTLVSDI